MRKYVQIYFLALMLMGLGLGCQATQKEAKPPDRFEKWRVMAENSPKVTPDARPYIEEIDRDVQQKIKALEQANNAREQKTEDPLEPQKKMPKMRLTMKMHDVPVPVLLRTLARAANVNILINETVSGQAKINISNVPWDEAFTGLLDSYGLTYKWSGDILRVITVEDLNKEIALMEAKQNYQKSKKEHALTMEAISRKQESYEPLMTRVVKINFADLDELRENLEKYLQANSREAALEKAVTESIDKKKALEKTNFRGAILKDTNTNSLVIQSTQTELNKILPIIQALDKPSLQILIEAHIVEATSDTARELGVQWGGLGATTYDGGTKSTQSILGTSAFSSETDDDGNNTMNFISNVIQDGTKVASEGGLSFGLLTQKAGEWALYTELSALQKEGKVNILSKPSITTLDHHKASIESGKEVPFQTVEDSEVSIEWRKAVISLEVTPHVINDNIVRLEIITHKDELDFSNTVDGNPTIITKNAETMVNLFDGQTTVIGGLNKENIEEGKSGVPGLMDVPGLGWLFRNTTNSADMEELLIFITPHILKGQITPPPVADAAAASQVPAVSGGTK
ncbi:type IV pilus secretin PilQ [Desulfobacter vibrioformis]|uniref:type IV pilus secretin PilQ n=1 Tax=Desulfobacter vibrioformis TaxID=34031 RepID=UPI00068990D8|nr:type IV pilus secretin PilQ [Desulfobacter vibrioformis]